ncbi:MAG TPA: peptide chain release factor N(5)-glutamine methyltransferase [Gaiellaceae bacterium]|nr:peptide chain release factor N(5)-glutamine methyltransferase [Gaiellaceae bacterium]
MTVGEALAHGTNVLAEAGIDTARLEAELLLAKACDDCARALLYMELRRELSPEADEGYKDLLARRAAREPLAYILGHWGFRRLTLKTDKRALIPRPETEIVVERALEHLNGGHPNVLDVGTGTGAIALAIVDEHPRAQVTAIDASKDALALARENLDLLEINGRVRLVEHDLTEGLGHDSFDLVVSNPPYVEPEDLETLQPEVRDWEPRIALVAHGATEAVARAATEALRPGGWVVLEIAENQAPNVAALLRRLGYEQLRVSPDMAGRDRVIEAQWTG